MARHLLRDDDLTPAEQAQVLDLAARLKQDRWLAKPLLGPQTVAIIFDKPSTRTRVSFAVGVADLGGTPLVIEALTAQLGAKESVGDTARVLERQTAAIIWRTYAQSGLEEMADGTTVPVINALSDDFHPCQLLADLQTIREHKGDLAGLTVAFVGDGHSNMAHSYLLACATAGMHVRLGAPKAYQPREDIIADARTRATETGGSITILASPAETVTGADVVVTDTWASMGQEAEKARRQKDFAGYTVDAVLMAQAKSDAIFMHCLPAYRGYEVMADVLDGPQSVIWDEAENRLHAQKALMVWLLQHSPKDV
jgi:ornithine carbamoyltransferase